jgi:hypothetical protein
LKLGDWLEGGLLGAVQSLGEIGYGNSCIGERRC